MTFLRNCISPLFASAAVVGLPAMLHAQDATAPVEQAAPADGKRQFRADFFAAYAPVTALDMVQRIPGFSIAGDEGRRGFGENAGNVLIDGDRPSTKSDDIFTILSRIPASEVDYIELTEQAGADAETQGQGKWSTSSVKYRRRSAAPMKPISSPAHATGSSRRQMRRRRSDAATPATN